MEIEAFKKIILDYYYTSGRDFPWRKKPDAKNSPWGILVSEFMLQQTQTQRVIPYWERWMKRWPRPADLAAAPLEEVLREWSGLGYNRRAKNLRECAGALVEKHSGKVPRTPELLITLPGIGPYSSGAIACFAWNYPVVFIETNIRSVVLHFFFGKTGTKTKVTDAELIPVLEKSLDTENPRVWYWALMDYGAELKKLTANPSRKSAHHVRQSPFKGSLRQIRGQIIKNLAETGSCKKARLRSNVETAMGELKDDDFHRALSALEKESMVAETQGSYHIKRG
jgi:A/G-specific adenine glycosylase